MNEEKKRISLFTIWDHLEEIILVPVLTASVLIIFAQVIARYIFSNSISWSEELARYLYVWSAWLGVAYAAKLQAHLRITIIPERLNLKARMVLEVIVYILWIAFAIFLLRQGTLYIGSIMKFGQSSTALRIPMQFVYAATPVGCGLMIIRLIENLVRLFKDPAKFFRMNDENEGKGVDA